jgi:hypothetical protein
MGMRAIPILIIMTECIMSIPAVTLPVADIRPLVATHLRAGILPLAAVPEVR